MQSIDKKVAKKVLKVVSFHYIMLYLVFTLQIQSALSTETNMTDLHSSRKTSLAVSNR